jgi:hypothetical protein
MMRTLLILLLMASTAFADTTIGGAGSTTVGGDGTSFVGDIVADTWNAASAPGDNWDSLTDPDGDEANIVSGDFAVTCDDDDDIYVEKAIPAALTDLWFQVAFEISDLTPGTIANSTSHSLVYIRNTDNDTTVAAVGLLPADGSFNASWTTIGGTDGGMPAINHTTETIAADTEYIIKCHWEQATGAGENDGIIQCWWDGGETPIGRTTLDNDALDAKIVRVGALGWPSTFPVTLTINRFELRLTDNFGW